MDFVFDIETLGTKPGAAILTVGLALVSRASAKVIASYYWQVDPKTYDEPNHPSFDKECSTIAWWAQQSEEATKEAFGGEYAIEQVLDEIIDVIMFYGGVDKAVVWGNGATFDVSILEEAFRRLGQDVPWEFYNVRCLRTLCSEMGVDWKRHLQKHRAHIAVEDAKAEARGLIVCLEKLRRMKNG